MQLSECLTPWIPTLEYLVATAITPSQLFPKLCIVTVCKRPAAPNGAFYNHMTMVSLKKPYIDLLCYTNPQALSRGPRESDVYHLAVNLLDRYLSYETIKTEEHFLAVAGGCSMISLKIRRANARTLYRNCCKSHRERLVEIPLTTSLHQTAKWPWLFEKWTGWDIPLKVAPSQVNSLSRSDVQSTQKSTETPASLSGFSVEALW